MKAAIIHPECDFVSINPIEMQDRIERRIYSTASLDVFIIDSTPVPILNSISKGLLNLWYSVKLFENNNSIHYDYGIGNYELCEKDRSKILDIAIENYENGVDTQKSITINEKKVVFSPEMKHLYKHVVKIEGLIKNKTE